MVASAIWSIVPFLFALWSIFVAKTKQLYPKQNQLAAKRKAKAISSERVKAVEDGKPVSDGATPGKELALPADIKAPPVYELYDHPAPPILVLGKALPSAPIGYGWELAVGPNEHNNPAMRLSLLNLATVTEMASIEADLVVVRRWKHARPDTYASFYRRAADNDKRITGYHRDHSGDQSFIYDSDHTQILGKVMMANLITPMVDWARLLVLRFITDNPDEGKVNYMLIESGQKVAEPVGISVPA